MNQLQGKYLTAFWKMKLDGDGTSLLRSVVRKGLGSIPTSSALKTQKKGLK